MFSCKIDNIELRLIEPRRAEELNALIERNFDHIKNGRRGSKMIVRLKILTHSSSAISNNLPKTKDLPSAFGFLVKWLDKLNTTKQVSKSNQI